MLSLVFLLLLSRLFLTKRHASRLILTDFVHFSMYAFGRPHPLHTGTTTAYTPCLGGKN